MVNVITVVACTFLMDPRDIRDRLVKLGQKHGVEMRGVIVANGTLWFGIDDPSWSVIRGSNEDLDFSAYSQGAKYWLSSDERMPNVVLFVNDSLFTSHSASTNLGAVLKLLPLLQQVQLPAIVGKADRYASICHRNPWGGQRFYVSTYCFALNATAIPTLLSLPQLADADGLGQDIDIQSPDWGSGLQPAFREFLRAHMVYQTSPYAWYNLRRHIDNKALIRRKTRCIYFEHRLSGELAKDGCILPTNASNRMKVKLFVAETLSRLFRRISIGFITRREIN